MAILQNTTVSGSLVVTGDLTARQFILSSSVTFFTESFASGSTRFGDSMDDTMKVTGSLLVTGSGTFAGALSGTSATFSSSVTAGGKVTATGGNFIYALEANAGTTSGQSYGLKVTGGTTSTDDAMVVYNAAASSTLFRIAGTGAATFSSSLNINGPSNDTDIALNVAAPSGSGKFIMFGRNSALTAVYSLSSAGAATFASTITAGVITGDGGSTGTPGIIAKNPSGGGNNGTFGFGNSSDYRIRGGSDYTAIIFDTAGSERMRIKNTQIIIGSTSNNAEGRLNVSGDSAGNSNDVRLEFSTAQTYGYFQCADRVNVATKRLYIDSADLYINYLGTGTVYSNGSVLTNTNPSDSRLKENINDIAFGLNEILQLRPVEYNWINDKSNQGKQYGFVAQEVQPIIPSLVKEFTIPASELESTEEMIRLGLEKDGIYVGLVKAIQELSAKVTALENK